MTAASERITAPVTGFFQWWLKELRACVPGARRSAAGRRPRTLDILVMPELAIFQYGKGALRKEIGRVALDRPDAQAVRADAARIRRRIGLRRTDVVLCLQPDQVLRRCIHLPLAAAENLREVLSFEMERHTAFRAQEVYYDYRIGEANHDEKRISVALVAVPRTIADSAIELMKSWNLAPDRVTVADSPSAVDYSINLLPPSVKAGPGRLGKRLNAALALAACGLAASAVYLELHRQQMVLTAYETSLKDARAMSVRVEELKKQVATMLDSSRYVAERKQRGPLATELLDEITRLLPDDTWVSQFRLQGDQLSLSGYSPAASTLIGKLEDSPVLAQVRFAAPVTLDPKLGMERFNLLALVAVEESRQ